MCLVVNMGPVELCGVALLFSVVSWSPWLFWLVRGVPRWSGGFTGSLGALVISWGPWFRSLAVAYVSSVHEFSINL